MANKGLIIVLALVFVQTSLASINITYTSNVQGQYAKGTASSIPFSFTINSLDDYLNVIVNISACPSFAWATGYTQWCLYSSCNVGLSSQPASPLTTNCAVQIPSNWNIVGAIEVRLQYFIISYSFTTPYWAKSIANFTIVDNSPVPCPLGQAPKSGICSNCSNGTYGDGRICTPCPLGYFGYSEGLSSCTPCAPGFYGGGGTAHCIISPAGYYAPGGTYRATACDPGTASDPGASSCQLCDPVTYNPSSGSQFCYLCPLGKIAVTSYGSTYCVACPPGTYASRSFSTCIYCPYNHYSTTLAANSTSSCIPCPSGTSQLPGCFHAKSCCV